MAITQPGINPVFQAHGGIIIITIIIIIIIFIIITILTLCHFCLDLQDPLRPYAILLP